MEPVTFEDHVANLFSDPEEATPAEVTPSEPDTGPETAASEPAAATTEPGESDSPGFASETDPSLDWARIAQARLREINALRTRYGAVRDRTDRLEKQMAELRKRFAPNEELPPELLEADPGLKFVTGKLKGIEQRLDAGQQSAEESVRFQQDTADTVHYAQESRKAFLAHTPSWDNAYAFVREQFAKANGREADPNKDEWLNVQEHIAVRQWLENGEDPALKIYEMAVANGWRLGASAAPVPPAVKANGNGGARVRRVRDAVAAPSPSSIGSRDLGSDVISREQFYERYPQQERIRIFNSDRGEDIFESLMKEGRISVSMLPRQQ